MAMVWNTCMLHGTHSGIISVHQVKLHCDPSSPGVQFYQSSRLIVRHPSPNHIFSSSSPLSLSPLNTTEHITPDAKNVPHYNQTPLLRPHPLRMDDLHRAAAAPGGNPRHGKYKAHCDPEMCTGRDGGVAGPGAVLEMCPGGEIDLSIRETVPALNYSAWGFGGWLV